MITFSIIQKSQLDEAYRMDAEYFATNFVFKDYYLGEHVAEFIQYGTSDDLNESKVGYPTLRLNEFDSYFIKEPEKYCSTINNQEFHKLQLKEGDVLICRTNGNPKLVGKSAIVMKNKPYAFASYLFRVRLDIEKINPSTLVTYLHTIYGRGEIERNMMISNQTNFSPARFRLIRIPKFNKILQKIIDFLFQSSYKLSYESKSFYQQAKDLLLEELGLKNFQEENDLSHIVNFSDVQKAGRVDADYFQPKYLGLIKHIEKYNGGFDFVKNQFKQNKSLSKKDKPYYNYVEISDLNVSNGEIIPNKIAKEEIPANGKITLLENDLLISKVRPYRGAVSYIDFQMEDLLGSGAFTVLQEKTNYKKEVLMIFLKLSFIKNLLLRYNCGTSYPVIKDEDILNLKIPLIKADIQKEIAELVKKSHEARKKSKQLLEEAKRKVEGMIEKGGEN